MTNEQIDKAFLEAEKYFGTGKAIGLLVDSGKLRNQDLL